MLRSYSLFRRRQGIKKSKKLFDVRNFERVVDPFADADQQKATAVLLMSNVGADQRSDSRRVHVGDFGEIDDERFGGVGPDLGLKAEHGSEDERTSESENALSVLGAGEIFDVQWLLWHRVILATEAARKC